MINRNVLAVGILCLFMACTPKDKKESETYLSGEAVWKKMMEHYDPDHKLLNATYQIAFDEGATLEYITTKSTLLISQAKNYCVYTQQSIQDTTKAPFTLAWKDGQRLAIVNGDTLRTEDEFKAARISTATIDYYGTYYLYIFGLPSNMKSGGAIFPDTVKSGQFMGAECLLFPIKYPKGSEREQWTYYLNPNTYQIIGGSYEYADPNRKSESAYAKLEGDVSSGDFRLIKIHDWYKADSSNWGIGNVTNITLLNSDSVNWLLD